MEEGSQKGNKRNITSPRPKIGNCAQGKQDKFTRSIELDYNELAFLFVQIHGLAKSKCSATMRGLYENISNKLEVAITDMDKEFKTSTEYTPLNITFFEDDEPIKS